MDEAGGCCGLLVVILVIVLVVVSVRTIRRDATVKDDPAPPAIGASATVEPGEPPAARRIDRFPRSPIGPRVALVVLGLLYGVGLLLVRPAAIRAKRHGASDQQAALSALVLFALSPVVVPYKGLWYALGALGHALTRGSGDAGRSSSKPGKPRGLDDLD